MFEFSIKFFLNQKLGLHVRIDENFRMNLPTNSTNEPYSPIKSDALASILFGDSTSNWRSSISDGITVYCSTGACQGDSTKNEFFLLKII